MVDRSKRWWGSCISLLLGALVTVGGLRGVGVRVPVKRPGWGQCVHARAAAKSVRGIRVGMCMAGGGLGLMGC